VFVLHVFMLFNSTGCCRVVVVVVVIYRYVCAASYVIFKLKLGLKSLK